MSRPSLRERLKPAELVGIAAVLGLFTGAVVLIGSGRFQLAVVLAGVAFIVGLVGLAMLALAAGAPADPEDVRPVQDRRDDERGGGH